MLAFFQMIADFLGGLWELLLSITLPDTGGISYGVVILVFLIISFCLSIFWKGAKA